MFNTALTDIVESSCSQVGHGDSCPMYDTISQQTMLSLIITSLIVLIALFLIFSRPEKEVVYKTKTIQKRSRKKYNLSLLKKDEKQVFNLVKENRAIFQADIIEKTGFGKAKMTRILDRLEGKNYIERKRRGMTNIVVLKE